MVISILSQMSQYHNPLAQKCIQNKEKCDEIGRSNLKRVLTLQQHTKHHSHLFGATSVLQHGVRRLARRDLDVAILVEGQGQVLRPEVQVKKCFGYGNIS